MNEPLYTSHVLRKAGEFLDTLPEEVRAKITGEMRVLCSGDFKILYVKKLQGKIRELIVDNYRILFFLDRKTIYFANGFRKKGQKTPKQEINYAEKSYKLIKEL